MSIVARRYALALMNLAAREQEIEAVARGLDDVADTFKESPQLRAFFSEPKVPRSAKEAAMAELLAVSKAPPLVSNFLRYVTRKRRIGLLEDMRRLFHELADQRMGRAHADVTVAATLTEAQQEGLRSRLEALSGKRIELRVKSDPLILGGVMARIGSIVWDGTLRNQLNYIQQSIIEG